MIESAMLTEIYHIAVEILLEMGQNKSKFSIFIFLVTAILASAQQQHHEHLYRFGTIRYRAHCTVLYQTDRAAVPTVLYLVVPVSASVFANAVEEAIDLSTMIFCISGFIQADIAEALATVMLK
jgi:hypothetical protein